MNNYPIDAVITWVDGSDPEWLSEKARHTGVDTSAVSEDGGEYRYRDWDNL